MSKTLLGEPRKDGLLTEEQRWVYAVEALEYIATPDARKLLEIKSQNHPQSPITRDAKAALGRLSKRAVASK